MDSLSQIWDLLDNDDPPPASATPIDSAPAPPSYASAGVPYSAAASGSSSAAAPGFSKMRAMIGMKQKFAAPSPAPAPAPQDPAPAPESDLPPVLPPLKPSTATLDVIEEAPEEQSSSHAAPAEGRRSASLSAILNRDAKRRLDSAGVSTTSLNRNSTKAGKQPVAGRGKQPVAAPRAPNERGKAPATARPTSAPRKPATASVPNAKRATAAASSAEGGGAAVAATGPAALDEEEEEDDDDDADWGAEEEGEEEGDEEEEDDDDEDPVEDDQEAEPGQAERWPKLKAEPCSPCSPLPLGARPRLPEDSLYPANAELNANVNQYLRDYQRDGVTWLWKQYASDRGGILGDEMGLGKTVQVAAFLSAVLGKTATSDDKQRTFPLPAGDCRQVLVVVPKSTLTNWQSELRTWGCFKVQMFHGGAKAQEAALRSAVDRECEVVLTTYDIVRRSLTDICAIDWEVTIWDEVHTIKNDRSATNRACMQVPCKRRFGLTGTPMSNKYEELWVLFNFASDGHVGSKKDFKSRYANSLGQGLKKNAKQWELMKRFRTQQGTPRAISSTRHPCPSVRLLPHADAAHPIHFACERRDQGADAELDAPTLQGHHRRPDAHEARQCRPLPTRG